MQGPKGVRNAPAIASSEAEGRGGRSEMKEEEEEEEEESRGERPPCTRNAARSKGKRRGVGRWHSFR